MKRPPITLKHAATCAQCGAALPAGSKARWYPGKIYGIGCHPAPAPEPRPAEVLSDWIRTRHDWHREGSTMVGYVAATWAILPDGIHQEHYPELWVKYRKCPLAAERAVLKGHGFRWDADAKAWWAAVVPLAQLTERKAA